MRIALVHDLPPGGARRAMVERTRALIRLGHVVEAFAPEGADRGVLSIAAAASRSHEWRVPALRAGREGLFTPPGAATLLSGARLLRAIRRSGREVAARVDAGGFDVVMATHDRLTHSPGVLRHLRTPAAYVCEEPLRLAYEAPIRAPETVAPGALRRAAGRVVDGALTAVLRSVDAAPIAAARIIVANSMYSAEAILRAYGRRAVVVPCGVDSSVFRPLGLAREQHVLAVGALHPTKGFHFLIDSLATIPAVRRPPLVIIANRASGGFRASIERHAAARSVALTIREGVSEGELVEAYGRAGVVAAVSYLEPFGLVPLEAMACGAPVVAVAEGGLRESVRDEETGLLAPRDEAAVGGAIHRVLHDRALAERLGAAGREDVVARWSWDAAAAKLLDALEACRRTGESPSESAPSEDRECACPA